VKKILASLAIFFALLGFTEVISPSPAQASIQTMTAVVGPSASLTGLAIQSTTDAQQALVGYPYDCPTASGNNGWFCMYSAYFFNMWTRYPATIRRNECNNAHGTVIGGTSTFTFSIVNTSGLRWMWFRDDWCLGAHIDIHPHTAVQLPNGWAGNATAAFMRTALITKTASLNIPMIKSDYALIG
jgi:hypothetical protein